MMMHRTMIMLPSDLQRRARRLAQERGISLGGLIREALVRVLEAAGDDHRSNDPLFADDAVFTGDAPSDLARHHDQYLYAGPSE
jgi:hypothetical protein